MKNSGWRLRLAKRFLALFFLVAAGYSGWLMATNNFHEVMPGKIYRSAQPGADELAGYVSRHGIRTVINLRGENPGVDWYDEEVAAVEKHGLRLINFGISARKQLTPLQVADLLHILRVAKGPVLIHCKAGADRTGLASALYLAAIEKKPEEVADRQLSIRFGHFSIPYLSEAYPMDETFAAYRADAGSSRILTSAE